MKGEIQIFVAEEASNLAMRVACRVAQDLEASGFRLLDAVSPQFDITRKKVGEHDIVAERRVRCGGYTSVELKLRVITNPKKTLRNCREQLRREAAAESKLWATCCLDPAPSQPTGDGHLASSKWAERVVFMVQFSSPDAQSWSQMRCESITNSAHARWTNIFGWEHVTAASPAPEVKRENRETVDSNAVPHKRLAPSARNFEDIWALEAVRKKTRQGKVYASVSDICKEIKMGNATRKRKHLDEWMPKWAASKGWANKSWDVFDEFRFRSGGGLGGVGAIRSVCTEIYDICNQP